MKERQDQVNKENHLMLRKLVDISMGKNRNSNGPAANAFKIQQKILEAQFNNALIVNSEMKKGDTISIDKHSLSMSRNPQQSTM